MVELKLSAEWYRRQSLVDVSSTASVNVGRLEDFLSHECEHHKPTRDIEGCEKDGHLTYSYIPKQHHQTAIILKCRCGMEEDVSDYDL